MNSEYQTPHPDPHSTVVQTHIFVSLYPLREPISVKTV